MNVLPDLRDMDRVRAVTIMRRLGRPRTVIIDHADGTYYIPCRKVWVDDMIEFDKDGAPILLGHTVVIAREREFDPTFHVTVRTRVLVHKEVED